MQCPLCSADTKVLETRRYNPAGTAMARSHRCNGCGHRFNTLEQINNTLVVKRKPVATATVAPVAPADPFMAPFDASDTNSPTPDPLWIDNPPFATVRVLPPVATVQPTPAPRREHAGLFNPVQDVVSAWTPEGNGGSIVPSA